MRSGIQETSGGVARYYRTDLERNQPVSTEITGYALSALLYLGQSKEAQSAADYLSRAWTGQAMPFETDAAPDGLYSYFFDCGIIVRGLLAAWRATGSTKSLNLAAAIGRSMLADFRTEGCQYHPILKLPEKAAAPHDPMRWSQSPGCYQLKSAMAWWELSEATGETQFRRAYECMLDSALRCYRTFLPGHHDPLRVVDRLHAFLYFLEGMLPCAAEERCAGAIKDGIERVACHLERAAPLFERADVYAQLLRIRIYADWMGIVPLDRVAAEREAAELAGFQAASDDQRIDGGFYFGRKGADWLPYVNPVSTAFGMQALDLWRQHTSGGAPTDWRLLI